jgi:F-type H+-transporting ATPase subunit b
MLGFLTILAAVEEAASEDIFTSLGIDFKILGLQVLAFVILVIILAKFIYPQINAMLERRDKVISDAIKSAQESEEKAAKLEVESAKELRKARDEANEIIEMARKESADMTTTAEFDAKKRAENIVREAQIDIAKEIETARVQLREETLDLVAEATEKIAEVKLGSDDEKLVTKTLKGKK